MAKRFEEEELIKKVGGRFKLASLLEKRYKELLFGARPLVDVQSNDPLETLLQEVAQGKIELVPEAEAVAAAAAALMAERSNEASEEMAVRAALDAKTKKEDEDEAKPEKTKAKAKAKAKDEEEEDEEK
jgi:DNA-directed RNA polymerase subunit omega